METISRPVLDRPALLSLVEVAALLRCTRRTVERQIAGQRLHVLKIGRAVRVESAELDRYLGSLRHDTG